MNNNPSEKVDIEQKNKRTKEQLDTPHNIMPFNFEHLCNLPPKSWKERYLEKLAKPYYDDRLDGNNENILFMIGRKTEEQRKQLHIHVDASNVELRNELIRLGFQHQLSFYVICHDSVHPLHSAIHDPMCHNITEVYIESGVSEKISMDDLPSTITHLYLQNDYLHKHTIINSNAICIQQYRIVSTFSGGVCVL